MKPTAALIGKLIRLAKGDSLPACSLRGEWLEEMMADGLLGVIVNGSRKRVRVSDPEAFRTYIAARFNIHNLEKSLEMLQREEASRSEQVKAFGDSKVKGRRTFTGFMVNSYQPILARLNGNEIKIMPPEGSFLFISDCHDFLIPEDVVIVGVENSENFRYVRQQASLFEKLGRVLFVARYPETQYKDLLQWLLKVPNRYVHFGDLDLAGISIYQREYYRHLGERASMLIPEDFRARISKGSTERYNTQLPLYGRLKAEDPGVQDLLDCIHALHRGYDQEGYIGQ